MANAVAEHSVLFVCLGNICRSPTAEGIARSVLGDRWRFESAGIVGLSGRPATAEAVMAAEELGVDLRSHRARHVAELDLARFDQVVALTPEIGERLAALGVDQTRILTLDIEDPYGLGIDDYRRCAAEIDVAVRNLWK